MKYFLRVICKILFRTKVFGFDKLNFDGPTILMPNHVSLLDSVILYPYLPKNVTFVVNLDIAKKFKFILRWINHTTIDPMNPYSLKKTILYVKKGNCVVIFPEGRITTTSNLMKIYNGISMIAVVTQAKIFPIILNGVEQSKFTRFKDKVKTVWFPKISIHIFDSFKFDENGLKDFRKNKNGYSDKILSLLQNAKYNSYQELYETENLFNKLLETSKKVGYNKLAVKDISSEISYKKAIISSYILGSKLKNFLKNDSKVAVLLPNSAGHFVTLFSLFYAGKITAIMNFTSGIANSVDCLDASSIKTIITSKLFIEKGNLESYITELSKNRNIIYLEDVKKDISFTNKLCGLFKFIIKSKAPKSENQSIILYTSGSENKPKGVVLTHKNIIANINQISCVIDLTHKDKMLNALPMFHSFGLTAGTFFPIFNGVEVFLYPTPLHYKIIPELSYTINATIIIGTPSFLMGYARNAHNYDFYSIRYVMAGGEKLKEEVKQMIFNKFGIRVLEGYGTTETSPVLSLNTPLFNKSGSVGRLLPGIQHKIEQVEGIEDGGNLFVKGDNVMAGYLLNGIGFVKSEEWYNCGDVVSIDKAGFVTIKARLKRFAKIAGEMVSLDLVESIANKCFLNQKVAAISVGDIRKGEKIILFTNSNLVDKKILREYYTENSYSTLALPSEVIVLENIPLLGNGKTDYIKLVSLINKI